MMIRRTGWQFVLVLIALAGGLACGARRTPASPPDAPTPVPGLESIITTFRSRIPEVMASEGPPALSVALVHRSGPLWIEGFGSLDEEGRIPVDGDTIFSLQSTSKAVTATALLAAVRDGLVDLDAPVSRYLPDFRVNSRFEDHPERRMTLRHLLGHRAGFTHEAPVGNNYATAFPSFEAHIDSIQETWLRYPVGRVHAYSNLGVDLAGNILGVVSGKGFARYVQETVLDPIGMTSSSFDWEFIRKARNRAVGHWKPVDEMPLEFALIPSGALYSSASDMAAFVQFQLTDGRVGGKSLIDETLLAQMRSPSFPEPGQILGYGLGLRRDLYLGRFYFHHSGAGFGFKSHMSWYPDLGIGIVVLTNSMDQNVVHSLAREILGAVAEAIGAEPVMVELFTDLEPGAVDPPIARRLAGTYLGRGSQRIDVVVQDAALAATLEGETLPLHLVSAREGFIEWGGDRLRREVFRFETDTSGRPVRLVRVLYGANYDFDHGPDGPPPGPDRKEWDAYIGRYEVRMAGQAIEGVEVRRENGYLFFERHRMSVEHEPGLFFSVTGEALDFRGAIPTWRNIPLHRVREEDPSVGTG